MSADAVMRIWHAFGLQPHRHGTWQLSNDPQFIEKVHDVCGLYLNPPERAVVPRVDKKSQIQALDRTAPTLPMLAGTPERATHDYERNGTTSLFAALKVQSWRSDRRATDTTAAGRVPEVPQDHRRERPEHLDVHLVLDHASNHKTPGRPALGFTSTRGACYTSPDLQQVG